MHSVYLVSLISDISRGHLGVIIMKGGGVFDHKKMPSLQTDVCSTCWKISSEPRNFPSTAITGIGDTSGHFTLYLEYVLSIYWILWSGALKVIWAHIVHSFAWFWFGFPPVHQDPNSSFYLSKIHRGQRYSP